MIRTRRNLPKHSVCRSQYLVLALFLIIISSLSVLAQEAPVLIDTAAVLPDSLETAAKPLPPTDVTVKDTPNDAGGAVTIYWTKSPDDVEGGKVKIYKIHRAEMTDGQPGEFKEVGEVPSGRTDDGYELEDGNTVDGVQYIYKVLALNTFYNANEELVGISSGSVVSGSVTSSAQWFDFRRRNVLVGVVVLCFLIIFYINQAKSGKELYIRKIAGMEAVDEAVGRATEMGKKIFYISGLGDMDNMQTIASITILGRVAELAAQYETYIDVPVCRSLVMVTAKEVVKESYSKAGRPDSFKEDQVHYLTDDQFGYAAAVDGMFVREKPATIFFMGQFFAESLILAETGNSIGAIQIAGTAMPAQLPFFVAACDYTLIGEELFAASAYLSKEPKLLGSLKGQDIGKGILLAALLIGVILESLGVWQVSNLFSVIE